ncbi:hypothetical protein EDC96DRAFT_550519 [Choanephora cucurbitarum]|nr:hypothetical protein EDC96DRAFT_550519 [Choanephora cucurbitarum]
MTSHDAFGITQSVFSVQNVISGVICDSLLKEKCAITTFDLKKYVLHREVFEQVDGMMYEEIKQWLSDSRGERIYSGNGTISFKQKALRVATSYIREKMNWYLTDDELDHQARANDTKIQDTLLMLFCDFHFEGKKRTDFLFSRQSTDEIASSNSNDPERSTVIDMEDVAEHH